MAQTINVTGPHTIYWGTSSANTALGRGDNNDLFKIQVTHRYVDIQTNEHGDMAANSVLVGATGTVSFSLVKWDTAQAAALQAAIGQTGGGGIKYPTVGKLTNNGITGDATVAFAVMPDLNGRIGVSVTRVRVTGFEVTDFGNRAARLVVSGEILPDGDAANADMFSITTS